MESLEKLWKANAEILKNIERSVTSHCSGQEKFPVKDDWEKIVVAGFFVALNKFRAIQYLMNPGNSQNFFMESASLARNLWEIWLTLAWLNHDDPNEKRNRIVQFKNDSMIDQDKLIQAWNDLNPGEESDSDQWVQDEVLEIKRQFPKEHWNMPRKDKMMEDVTKRDQRYKNSLSLYYKIVYRDLSHYVHFTSRTIEEIDLWPNEKEMIVYSHLGLGINCLEVSCGFFIFITEIWNSIFKIIPDQKFEEWYKDWLRI